MPCLKPSWLVLDKVTITIIAVLALAVLFFLQLSCLAVYCVPPLVKIALLHEGLGIMTNNAAEYCALILVLNYASKKGFKYIVQVCKLHLENQFGFSF